MSKKVIEKTQSKHWENKLKENPNNLVEAVGSESVQHKTLRYDKIVNIIQDDNDFSILDIGAGIGDLYGYLEKKFHDKNFQYTGIEVTESFHNIAKKKYPEANWKLLNILHSDIESYDFVFISGLFHQNGEVSKDEWEKFFFDMLLKSYSIANKGVVFNALSGFADYQREGNFYIDLNKIVNFILENLSRYFIIDYASPLFEFTINVFSADYISKVYDNKQFEKYFKKTN